MGASEKLLVWRDSSYMQYYVVTWSRIVRSPMRMQKIDVVSSAGGFGTSGRIRDLLQLRAPRRLLGLA